MAAVSIVSCVFWDCVKTKNWLRNIKKSGDEQKILFSLTTTWLFLLLSHNDLVILTACHPISGLSAKS